MRTLTSVQKLAQPFDFVKSPLNTQLPLSLDPLAYHKDLSPYIVGNTLEILIQKGKRYGVQPSQRILSPKLFLRRFDDVRQFLKVTLRLSTAEREGLLRTLKFPILYGHCYPKAAQVCAEPGCSERTFWYLIDKLERRQLVKRINRFLIREHAQISNLYDFTPLLILIARYLAEHGVQFYQKWLQPYLAMTGQEFWSRTWVSHGRKRDYIWDSQTP